MENVTYYCYTVLIFLTGLFFRLTKPILKLLEKFNLSLLVGKL